MSKRRHIAPPPGHPNPNPAASSAPSPIQGRGTGSGHAPAGRFASWPRRASLPAPCSAPRPEHAGARQWKGSISKRIGVGQAALRARLSA
ncbi:MAG: hypothetical protein M3380_12365, partial [Chloroflexota bacterium]|nr:hypothetical protein [Chloroflexota bacterium]